MLAQYEINSANEVEGWASAALIGWLWPQSTFCHFVELFGPCCLDKELNETLAARTCCFSASLDHFLARSGRITSGHWNFNISMEIMLIFFLGSMWKHNYYEYTYSLVPFGFHPIIRMWPEYLFQMVVISIQAYKMPFKSLSDWDHLTRLMVGHVVPLTVIVSCTNKIYTFLRENQYHYQEKQNKTPYFV